MGRMTAEEFAADGFFDGIDLILPIPLERKRRRQRGYNQSLEIARGVAEVTGLPIDEKAVKRLKPDQMKMLAEMIDGIRTDE